MAKTKTKGAAKRTGRKASSKKAKAKAPTALQAIKAKYPHVAKVTQTGKRDQATRVEITCQAEYDEVKCEGTREIATQDAFQVTRCHACQRHYLKIRRRKSSAA